MKATTLEEVQFETKYVGGSLWKTYALDTDGECINGWASEEGPEHSMERAVEALKEEFS